MPLPWQGGIVAGAGAYDENSSATVTATANTGYHFVKWVEGDEEISASASYTFTVTKDRRLKAIFEANQFYISLYASPEEAGTVEGEGYYNENTSVNIKAIANKGYHFVKWIENTSPVLYRSSPMIDVSTDPNYTFNITNDRSLIAIFEKDAPVTDRFTISLSASPAAGGTVEGSGTYDKNSAVTVKAIANTGYHFVKWIENINNDLYRSSSTIDVSTDPNYIFDITKDRSLTAIFEKNTAPLANKYTVTLSVAPSSAGSVTGAGTYDENNSVNINAIANSGYRFVKWVENNTEISKDSSYNFNINSNRSLVALFEKEIPILAPKTGDNSHTGMYILMMIFSFSIILLTMNSRKKKNK